MYLLIIFDFRSVIQQHAQPSTHPTRGSTLIQSTRTSRRPTRRRVCRGHQHRQSYSRDTTPSAGRFVTQSSIDRTFARQWTCSAAVSPSPRSGSIGAPFACWSTWAAHAVSASRIAAMRHTPPRCARVRIPIGGRHVRRQGTTSTWVELASRTAAGDKAAFR